MDRSNRENKTNEKLEMVAKQIKSVGAKILIDTKMICSCGKSISLMHMHRCFYCGEWFCPDCAKTHFETDRIPHPGKCPTCLSSDVYTDRKGIHYCDNCGWAQDSINGKMTHSELI
jgi:predicted Zn-ribbon and HTH transcriptional regulator